MVLEKLGENLKATLSKIAKAVFVDDKLINELVKDIQRALLQADVNVKLVFSLTTQIKDRIKSEDTPQGLTKREHLVNIVYEELVAFLGGGKTELTHTTGQLSILLVGLFGSGKTTTSGKLAKYFAKRGKRVALVGLDVHRPAAMAQIEQVAHAINIPTFTKHGEKDALRVLHDVAPKLSSFDVVIYDTAGRDALSEDLIAEISAIHKHIKPQETLLVISGDIGQAAQTQAQAFHDSCGVTGVIITKMDGRAGGRNILGKFIPYAILIVKRADVPV